MTGSDVATSHYHASESYRLSFTLMQRPWQYPLHGHDHGEIMIVVNGEIIQTINGSLTHSRAGDIILLRPGDTHELSGHSLAFYTLMFKSMMLEHIEAVCGHSGLLNLLMEPKMPPTVTLPHEQLESLVKQLNKAQLVTDANQQATCLPKIFSEIILDHFAIFSADNSAGNSVDNSHTDNRPAWLIETVKQVELSHDKSISVADLAAIANVSPEHLSRSFRKFMGITPSTYLTKQRLLQACRLLRGTNHKIVDICYQVGFENLSYFCNMFRKEYDATPRQYRQRHSTLASKTDATDVS